MNGREADAVYAILSRAIAEIRDRQELAALSA